MAFDLARRQLVRRRRARAMRRLAALSEQQVLTRFGVRSRDALAERLTHRTHHRFFLNNLSPSTAAVLLRVDFSEGLVDSIFSDADAICRHEFDLLGSGPVNLGPRIDWHRDFKSGYTWDPRRGYDQFSWRGLPEGVDVKVPWELSRFQHAVTLGKAYWLGQKLGNPASVREGGSDHERYAREFVNQLTAWRDANPVGCGVNWHCTMDVALRITNLIWGYYFFYTSPSWTDDTHALFARLLIEHGEHIVHNLETRPDGITSNHYLSNIVGLLYIGLLFPEIRDAQRWCKFAVAELAREIERQVLPDGADFESSIPYHRLVTELFAYSAWLCRLNRVELPRSFWQRLERMFEFALHYLRPDGAAPQIGDADDGRLHILANYSSWDRCDHRYLLAIGAVLFERNDFAAAAAHCWEEAFWLCGEAALRARAQTRSAAGTPPLASRAFRDVGLYFMRTAHRYLVACANPVGTSGIGNHKHNDLLSFEIYAGDKPLIVDPGSYIYTGQPQWRNRFRATAYHNTVRIDGREQNTFAAQELFCMSSAVRPLVREWSTTDSHDFFDAEYHMTAPDIDALGHRRQICFDKEAGAWIVRDVLTGTGRHTLEAFLHFAPLPIDRGSDHPGVIRTRSPHGTNLIVLPVIAAAWTLTLEEGWVSDRYGVKAPAPVARYHAQATLPLELVIVLWPYVDTVDLGAIRQRGLEWADRLRHSSDAASTHGTVCSAGGWGSETQHRL